MLEPATLLVIEDELLTRRSLAWLLRQEGYRVLLAATGEMGLRCVERSPPDVVLLDLGLPDIPGIEVAIRIRMLSRLPIIVVSGHDNERQKVQVLDAGAHDYVLKPFSPGELLARIRVALRVGREMLSEPRTFQIGALRVDVTDQRVTLDQKRVDLSPTEYQLLKALLQARGELVTHRRLLQAVWGPAAENRVNYLRVYMKRLRTKLESCPERPRYLLTEPGVGYRLALDEPSAREAQILS